MTIQTEVIETKLGDDDEFVISSDVEDDGEALASSNFRAPGGSMVARGSHVVPPGVAVEELKNYGGHKDLKNKCPEDVRNMLEERGLFNVYDRFVQSVFDAKTTRSSFRGKWRDQQFISVLDQFRDDFMAKGIKVALCKRKSGKGTFRWLEFIDVELLDGSYVPQYDVSNLSGQIIKTVYTKLEFPNGVAVEELKQWGGRRKLKEKIPIHVEKMLQKHNLISEYEQMVDHVVEAGVGNRVKTWKLKKLKELLEVYKPMFADKGVDIFICHKEEYVSHGNAGGHTEYYRWIEFVDRDEQPSYRPQRDAQTKPGGECVVS